MASVETAVALEEAEDCPAEDELRPEIDPETGIDLSLIDYCLSLTPWERLQANDAALNFAEELQEAMRRHHEQS